MEDNPTSSILDGEVVGIRFGMATREEICTASISDSSISHASQLSNPFLGLPLEYGRCESCGTSEAGKCEGHFGYIELPVPIYHPSHVSELKRMLSLICLSCLKMKKTKFPSTSSGLAQRLISPCCQDANAAQVSIREIKTTDGACYLVLKVSKSKMHDGFWSFLEKYGYRYEGDHTRTLLPCEVMEMIKRFPPETKKKLAGKGYFPQDGYVMKYLPVPPNCLSVPVVSDGVSVMSSDPSMTFLRKLLRKVEVIRSSRSGEPNFESHQVEANELQSVVDQYLQIRGCAKPARDIETHFGVSKELSDASNKAWLDKMKSLFISKGSGFSSRSVITGDGYKRINEVGIPLEVAQRITFEERVNAHNMGYLQKLVDENLCLTYREGLSTFSLREGSKGHTYLKPGQIVHRRIMDGDTVFINRPPTTHKHSLQALVVYIHDDHTVKINPLICGPLGADFDGDCVHLFYPQSLAAKAEVVELFSVEKQLLSSHSGNLNLQLSTDSLLSLKMLAKKCFMDRPAANQLAMFLSLPLPRPALLKAGSGDSYWTSIQILQCALPLSFDCTGGHYLIRQSDVLEFDVNRDALPAVINEIAASIFFGKGPQEALNFFDVLQPFLMESLFSYGFSVGLQDFSISRAVKRITDRSIGKVSPLLYQLRCIYNELVAQQLEKHMQDIELPAVNFASKLTRLGDLIDPKSKSALDKVVQQIGFLGQQLFVQGRLYSKGLLEDVASHFKLKCYYDGDGYPSAEYGLLKGCFFHGLDPFEELVHSISTREIMVRSSRGLSEPGTLFKNLMAILRDVVVCYDGTVRNVCSNSIIQFEYGVKAGDNTRFLFPAGEPVGVLAATSMSNPAYKAVLDASPSSNCSWELMKEVLLCKVNFRNEPIDRRVILYLNDCDCGRRYCRENAAYIVKNQLRKVSLKDTAVDFIVEYQHQRKRQCSPTDAGLVGHIHLDEVMLEELKINMAEVFQRCQEKLRSFNRKRKLNHIFKGTELFFSESCASPNFSSPCVTFIWLDGNGLDKTTEVLADIICPVLLDTIIQGDPRISSANITWVNPDSNTWVRNPSKSSNGELALDIVLEKAAVKQSGDAWRIVLDSCLPVLHLIDTRRSIPYAIKQIQELLGISCTFDQAIQRLAASVKMVAKGLLREHLILLASSMTCGGNLVGFNTGGYKALARQLNIQVPFTDATLFTPRRCFERAAEKCHTDSLSSIVASCSWGKPVAVGTGSRFDVLWDAKEIKSNEIEGMDVYNFLHMVKSLTDGEEENNACLGEDIDDLLEEENGDCGMSPQHASGFDAVFEENFEVLNGSESNGWNATADQIETKTTQWSAWDNNKAETKDGGPQMVHEDSWTSRDVIKDNSKMTNAWDGNMNQTKTISNEWTAWGKNKCEIQDNVTERAQGECGSSEKWKIDAIQEAQDNSWSSQTNIIRENTSKADAWGANNDTSKPKSNNWSTWGKNKEGIEDGGLERAQEDSWSFGKLKAESKVGADTMQEDSSRSNAWERISDNVKVNSEAKLPVYNSSWGKPKFPENQAWVHPKESNQDASSCGWDSKIASANSDGDRNFQQGKPKVPENQAWDPPKESNQGASSCGWGSQIASANSDSDRNSQWGKPKIPENQACDPLKESNQGASSRGWDSQIASANSDSDRNFQWGKPKVPEIQAWDPPKESNQGASSCGWDSQIASANSDSDRNSQWGKPKIPENQACDPPKESNQRPSSRGWDSQIASANSDSDRNFQWGKQGRESFKKSRFEGSQGWGSNRPGRAPGQRLDIYSSEEQDILKEIEPIVQSIRRIMQQEGYNDGDPLAADDQQFILENVFEHHPDKETKMGAGIDYVMVSRHTNFQESRCLYVVLKDGLKEDFSYKKCLDNLIKKKYPDLAESFIGKYFRKPRPRPDQTPTPAGDQTPTPAGDQTPTPAGDQPQTPVPVEKTNE